MHFATLLLAFCVSSTFALPTSSQEKTSLVARQTAGEAAVNQYNAAQTEYDAAQAAYQVEVGKLPRNEPFTINPPPRSPEFIQASERYSKARTNLEAAENQLLNTADAPKEYKLRILSKRKTEAERRLESDKRSLQNNQETADGSIKFWEKAVAEAANDEEREDRQWLLDRVREQKPETLKRDQGYVDASTKKLQEIDAQIAAVNAS